MFGCTYLRKCSECLYLSTTKSNPRGVARKWVGCMDVEGLNPTFCNVADTRLAHKKNYNLYQQTQQSYL